MDHSKVLQSYSSEKIAQVINLCDNLFYNNYLTTGVLNSREEIQTKIKGQVEESFIGFWGQSHSKKFKIKLIPQIYFFVSNNWS
jgi:hypothetical protein